MRVEVRVYPREGVLDPQGKAIAAALGRLGHGSVRDVRAGKVFFIDVGRQRRASRRGRRAEDGRGAPRQHGDRGLRREGAGRMKFAIVVFPGSNCDEDCFHVAKDLLGCEADYIWHHDTDLKGADAVILPGGFAYGDYLRAGALARFSPVMESVAKFAAAGGAGARHLQRLPGAARGGAPARARCRSTGACATSAATST